MRAMQQQKQLHSTTLMPFVDFCWFLMHSFSTNIAISIINFNIIIILFLLSSTKISSIIRKDSIGAVVESC